MRGASRRAERRWPWLIAPAVFALGFAGTSCSESVPVRGLADSRIRSAVYDADQVYQIRGAVGYQIDLQFEPGESFVGLGAGDIEGLSFVSQDNHLFIKPKAASVGTNLTVLTNRRSYQFVYNASAMHPSAVRSDVIFAIRFTYPHTAEQAATDGVNRMLDQASSGRPRNFNYGYRGSPSLKPTAASDDGIHTRLRFGGGSEQPAIFKRNDDGSQSLLNFSMEEGDVVIHTVARDLVVRRGKLTGCIVNEAFTGTAERLDSGTTSPDVKRTTSGVAP